MKPFNPWEPDQPGDYPEERFWRRAYGCFPALALAALFALLTRCHG